MIFVKPKAGLIVRHPGRPEHILPEAGAFIESSPAWKRLINDGDVVVDETKVLPAPEKAKVRDSKGGKI